MAKKLQLLPDFFINMDNIVSWQPDLDNNLIVIDTVISTMRIGPDAYTNDVQVTSNDLKRIMDDINAYFD